ncbi:MAG: TIM barrel protein [Fuerstiella sp.]
MDVVLNRTNADLSVTATSNQVEDAPSPTLLQSAEILMARDFDELVAEVRQLQRRRIRMVSLRRQRALRIGPDTLQEVLSDAGLEVCTVGFAGGFTGTLDRSYQQAIDDTRRALEFACKLNARAVVVLPGSQGRHIYSHAERCAREGLEACLDDALRYRVDMLVPLNTMLGKDKDIFVPRKISRLKWLNSLNSHRILPMMMLRNKTFWKGLPECFKACLAEGGALRISGRTRKVLGSHAVLNHLSRTLDDAVLPVA